MTEASQAFGAPGAPGSAKASRASGPSGSSGPLEDPSALLGAWVLSRTIEDRLLGVRSRVQGRLTLDALEPGRIRWQERGRWQQPTGPVEVSRCLALVRDPVTRAWEMRFEDERPFHPWLPGRCVVHPCGADTYRGLVEGSQHCWIVKWEVIGPGKDYLMTTELTRQR